MTDQQINTPCKSLDCLPRGRPLRAAATVQVSAYSRAPFILASTVWLSNHESHIPHLRPVRHAALDSVATPASSIATKAHGHVLQSQFTSASHAMLVWGLCQAYVCYVCYDCHASLLVYQVAISYFFLKVYLTSKRLVLRMTTFHEWIHTLCRIAIDDTSASWTWHREEVKTIQWTLAIVTPNPAQEKCSYILDTTISKVDRMCVVSQWPKDCVVISKVLLNPMSLHPKCTVRAFACRAAPRSKCFSSKAGSYLKWCPLVAPSNDLQQCTGRDKEKNNYRDKSTGKTCTEQPQPPMGSNDCGHYKQLVFLDRFLLSLILVRPVHMYHQNIITMLHTMYWCGDCNRAVYALQCYNKHNDGKSQVKATMQLDVAQKTWMGFQFTKALNICHWEMV